MKNEDRTVPLRILVLAAFACAAIVIVFARELATHRLFARSLSSVDDIVVNAIPSIDHLSNARGALRTLGTIATTIGPVSSSEQPDIERRMGAVLRETETHVGFYESLRPFEGEREKRAELHAAIAAVKSAAALVASAKTEAEARRADEKIDEAVGDFERTLEVLISINARAANDAAHEIVERQEVATRVSQTLLVFVLVGVIGAAILAERRLARSDTETRRRMEELDAFASRAAHDLRGPLTPAVLAVSRLRREPGLGEPARAQLELAARSHARIASIIDGLLAFARAGAGGAAERTSVEAAVADIVPALERLAVEESARLEVDVPRGLEVAVSRVVLGSILDNLARNALLYLGESTERIVRLRARAEGRVVLLEVADTGPGMPADVQARIFKPFERASTRPGTGLGLATVKRLAEAHGGSVSVRSVVGAGSTFIVTLPGPERRAAEPRRGDRVIKHGKESGNVS